MSLRANLKVPKHGLFYFASDRTVSIVSLKKIEKVISGDNVSKGSKVMLKYGKEVLQAEIIGVNDDTSLLRAMELDFLTDPANAYLFAETVETSVPETSVSKPSVSETSVPKPRVPETSVPETSVPETSVPKTSVHVPDASVPETIVKPQKRKQPVTQATSKKRRNNATQKNKKKEPELATVVSLYKPKVVPIPAITATNILGDADSNQGPSVETIVLDVDNGVSRPSVPSTETIAESKKDTEPASLPVPSKSAVPAIPDDSLNQFSPLARSTYSPSPRSRRGVSTPISRTRPNITHSLFSDLSFEAKVLGYFEELRQQQKENAAMQKAILHKLDALVSVLSEPAHFVPMTSSEETHVPDTNFKQADPCAESSAEMPDMPDALDHDDETLSNDCLMFLRAKLSSERNFAVQVVRHLFKPHELEGRNVRGVNGKLPLNSTKLEKVRQLVIKFYPVLLSCKESQWRDCRKAIDTYLRGKKYQMVHRVE